MSNSFGAFVRMGMFTPFEVKIRGSEAIEVEKRVSPLATRKKTRVASGRNDIRLLWIKNP